MKDIEILIEMAHAVVERIQTWKKERSDGNYPMDGKGSDDADILAESVVLEKLEEQGLDWNVISEESPPRRSGSEFTLILDPVDGSHNADRGIPFYSSSLALSRRSVNNVESAVVVNLYTGDLYQSVKGNGAYMNGIRIHTKVSLEGKWCISSYLGHDSMFINKELFSLPGEARYMGSISLETCMVAQGSLDAFCVFGRKPRLFDIAASKLILEESGGELFVINSEGSKLNYYLDKEYDDYIGIVAVGNRSAMELIDNAIENMEEFQRRDVH